MLKADFSTGLLTEQRSDNRSSLLAYRMTGDVVRYREQDERVHEHVEPVGDCVVGQQRVGVEERHDVLLAGSKSPAG